MFSKEEKIFICKGSYDLVLIERATETFREYMMKPNAIEDLLTRIVKASKLRAKTIIADTFPLSTTMTKSEEKKFNRLLQVNRKNIEDAKQKYDFIVTLYAIDLKEAGGHWAAFFYDVKKNVVEVYDSMQIADYGHYTDFFDFLGKQLFIGAKVVHPGCKLRDISLQETGGFSENIPFAIQDMLDQKIISKKQAEWWSIQTTESQNHFCYMWAIWYIHLRLQGYDFNKIISTIVKHKKFKSLYVIKSYIWNIAHIGQPKMVNKLSDKKIFQDHFKSVWLGSLKNKNISFTRYELEFNTAKTINECLTISLQPVNLEKEEHTPPPKIKC